MNREILNLNKKFKNIKTNKISSINIVDYKQKNILTYGTFDILHEGHIKIIKHAIKITGSESNVYVGVSSDSWNSLKGKESAESQEQRIKAIKNKFPNISTFYEDHEKPEQTWPEHWDKYKIDLIIMGEDHVENLSYINEVITPKGNKMKIAFFERTPEISSTEIREILKNKA